MEDLETLMVMAEDSDMNIGSENELDLGTVIARVGSSEDDQPNVLIPNLGNERKLRARKANDWARNVRMWYAHMPTSSIKHLLNIKLLFLKVVLYMIWF